MFLLVFARQTQPAGRRQAGSLQGRERVGGSRRQDEEVHGWRSAQPGRPGEETHLSVKSFNVHVEHFQLRIETRVQETWVTDVRD